GCAALGGRRAAARAPVALDLPGAQATEEVLNEIRRRNDLDTEGSHELDGAGIDAREIRDRSERAVFHRHAPAPGQDLTQPLVQLTVSRVGRDGPGSGRHATGFDAVDEQHGLAVAGYPVGPTAREQVTAEVEGGDGGGILAAEAPQQPAIERLLGERVLNLSDR